MWIRVSSGLFSPFQTKRARNGQKKETLIHIENRVSSGLKERAKKKIALRVFETLYVLQLQTISKDSASV
jgi:hypothetical protein